MNHCAIQKSAFRNAEGMICPKPRRIGALNSSFNDHSARSLLGHISHKVELCESKAENDILEIILTKLPEYVDTLFGLSNEQAQWPPLEGGGGSCLEPAASSQLSSSPPFFSGSPPSRVSNPVIQDSRFRDNDFIITQMGFLSSSPPPQPSSSSARNGGCIRASFRNSPAIRVEGFDCLDRDRRRNHSIPALA